MNACFLTFLAGLAVSVAAQTFPVAGVIVNTQTGSPMNRARMVLTAPQGKSSPAPVVTREDGRFSFQVPAGKYSLTAESGGVRQSFGLEGPATGFGVAIIVGSDQDTASLSFHWFPPGAITGTVAADRGEPVERGLVQLIRSSIVGGRKRLVTAGWFWTDDRGAYRFAPLVGGTFYLAVTAEPWYIARSTALIPRMPNEPAPPSEPTAAYAPLYYPSASDLHNASALILKPGSEIRADFRLRTVTGVNVRVNCSNAAGRTGLLSLIADRIEGAEGAEGFQRQINFYGNGQTIAGVPPGRYVVRIAGSGENPFSVRKTIDVGAIDVTVDLPIQPAPLVSGKVTFANASARPKSSLYVRLQNDANTSALTRALEPDGSFAFNNVPVAQYRPQITGADGFFVEQASAEGATLKEGLLDVVDGAAVTLTLVASDQTGHVKGFVLAGDNPIPGVLAVLAPKKESTDPGAYRGFQTDSDGSFDWVNVRAGDYVMFAVAKLDLEYASAQAVRPYLAGGKPIRIEPHGAYTERIALSPVVP